MGWYAIKTTNESLSPHTHTNTHTHINLDIYNYVYENQSALSIWK